MEFFMIAVFVLGYLAIALEHSLHVDKAAPALLIGMISWGLFALYPSRALHIDEGKSLTEIVQEPGLEKRIPRFEQYAQAEIVKHEKDINGKSKEDPKNAEDTKAFAQHFVIHGLEHHLFDIAAILFFLMGAMTIVELIDAHEGFAVITDKVKTTNKVKLMWILCGLTFFMSAALDNLTTSIVMISVIRKLIKDQGVRWTFAGLIVIAANAGGAWSPIGDVTTTMLWNSGQLPTSSKIVVDLILPSLVTMIVPLVIMSFIMKGEVERPMRTEDADHYLIPTTQGERAFVFFLGLAGLLFVPVFKTVTHLPPFTGMMLSLGIVWAVTEVMHKGKSSAQRKSLSPITVLQKIDTASVLFFLGILMAVAALQEVGILVQTANILDDVFNSNIYAINMVIGLLSAIVDNVPLVAAAQGMYQVSPDMASPFAADGEFWQFLAYCAGTGGSALIIGSAAGVAVMGLEKISFGWYMKKISLLAIVGYFAGAMVYIAMYATH
jgi:Na+/H+ antiporter NhaD/arsenite permease-like protein